MWVASARGHGRTWSAEPALGPMKRSHTFLHGVDVAPLGAADALDGGDMEAVQREQGREAGVGGQVPDGGGVGVEVAEHDGAGSAAPLPASQLGARQTRAAQILGR
jgi:hypothetical protein